MTRTILFLGVFLLGLAQPPLGVGQQDLAKPQEVKPTSTPASQDKKNTELEEFPLKRRGIDLLRQAGDEASSLSDPYSIARIKAAAGDALWESDQELARQFFRDAFEAALTHYRENKSNPRDPMTRLTAVSPSGLCQEIIRLVISRDKALGQEFTKRYNEERQRLVKDGEKQGNVPLPDESYLFKGAGGGDLSLKLDEAASLFRTSPQTAIAQAQSILSKHAVPTQEWFLWKIAEQDRAAADQFFLWLLAQIYEDETAGAGQLLIIAAYPFSERFVMITDGIRNWGELNFNYDSKTIARISRGRDVISEDLLGSWFIDVSFTVLSRIAESDLAGYPDALSRLGAAAYLAKWLSPKVEVLQPARVSAWQNLALRLFSRLPQEQQNYLLRMFAWEEDYTNKSQQFSAKPTISDPVERIKLLLEKAEKTSNFAERDQLYQQAALEADRMGNLVRALQIADKIEDRDFRGQVRDWVYFNAATRALSKNELVEAHTYALEVKAPDQCASLLCGMARAALKEKDKARAIELLTEAEQQAGKADNSPAKVRALLNIANLLASFDPPRALETMSSAVRAANRVPNYSAGPVRMVRTLGSGATQKHALIQNMESVDLGAGMARLAAVDFDGTLTLAESLENKPLKLTSIIAVASSVLNKKPEPETPAKKAKN